MRVAIVCRAWFPNHQALLERVQGHLTPKGIQLRYVLLADTEAGRPWTRAGGRVVPQVISGVQFSALGKEIMLNWGLSDALDQIAPDVVVISPWSELGSFVTKAWAKRARVPSIGWVMGVRSFHWNRMMAMRGIFTRSLLRRFVHGMDELFAYGDGVARAISSVTQFPLGKIVNVKHCVDESLYFFDSMAERSAARYKMRRNFSIDEGDFVFGYIGQLIKRKGFHMLLHACESLWLCGQKFKLFVLGRGPLNEALAEINRRFPGRVLSLDRIEPTKLRDCYAMADCVVVPSLFDDWSTVVNEAFCARTPVIASNGAYATLDLVRNGRNGYAFSAGRLDELGQCMSAAMAHRGILEKFGSAGHQFIKENWNIDISARIWSDRLAYWANSRA